MPIGDWQFWVVTLAALWGLWFVVRLIVPRRRGGAGCSSCASSRATGRTQLTVERRRVGRRAG